MERIQDKLLKKGNQPASKYNKVKKTIKPN